VGRQREKGSANIVLPVVKRLALGPSLLKAENMPKRKCYTVGEGEWGTAITEKESLTVGGGEDHTKERFLSAERQEMAKSGTVESRGGSSFFIREQMNGGNRPKLAAIEWGSVGEKRRAPAAKGKEEEKT